MAVNLVARPIANFIAGAAANAAGPSFRQLLKQELQSAVGPALFGGLYYGQQYYDPEDPLGSTAKIAGLIGMDIAGSTLLSAGAQKAANKIMPGKLQKIVNPEYQQNLNTLGLDIGATPEQIRQAQKLKIIDINKTEAPFNVRAAQAADVKRLAESLQQMPASAYFADQYQPSTLGNIGATIANIGFSTAGMNKLVEEPLIQAGILNPSYMREQQMNEGLVPQADVIAQQMSNRAAQGMPNNAIMAPDTMSQLTSMEIERLLNELPQQAALERDALMYV